MGSPAVPAVFLAALAVLGVGTAHAEGAAQALRRSGVVLLAPADPGDAEVDEALAAELWAGLQALPEPARAFPGGPLEIRLRAAPAPLGMGDGSRARPEWEGGRRRFVLYGYQPPDDDLRATYRLEGLDAAERERLWRRRALVHAVLARWDEARRWSRQPAFRRLTGWKSARRPGNDWAWIEARLLDSQVHWGLQLPRPQLVRVDVYVAALWALPSDPELTRSRFPGGLGFGGEYRLLRRESVVDAMHQLRGGMLLDLVGKASEPAHLLLYAGPELRAWSDLRPLGLAAGGFARLTGRVGLPGSGINGLRLSVAWSPAYALWRPGLPGLGHEVEAEGLVQFARGTGRPWGLDAGGWFELESDVRGRRVAGGVRALVKVR
jgi:hypothetical protein